MYKKKYSIPIIKEKRVSKLVSGLNCFDKYPYNREKQKDCILKLYPGKSEKSVFRGMIIPSLRYLGLIVGYEDLIRPSANGKLILEARKRGKEETIRATRILMLELDNKKFGFIKRLNQIVNLGDFINLISKKIEIPSEKQKEERIIKWLDILDECKLVKYKGKKSIILQKENINRAEAELKISPQKNCMFKDILFEKYKSLPHSETAGIIDIAVLRELVAIEFYRKHNLILTEFQFDKLLGQIPFVTEDYIISLGHPMGSEEKLFYYKGEYYRTLNIRFLKKEVNKDD